MNLQTIPFSEFLNQEQKTTNSDIEINVDLRWLRRGLIIVIVIGGILMFPNKVV